MKYFAPTRSLVISGVLLLLSLSAQAQCDKLARDCSFDLLPFNWDGQYYRAQLFPGEKAELEFTFYEGLVYRMVPCGASEQELVIFDLYDQEGNLLFSNQGLRSAPYWDISFGSTLNYTVVLRYEKGSGCAALLVGYLPQQSRKPGDSPHRIQAN